MKNTKLLQFFISCALVLSAHVAQAQYSACPATPDITVFDSAEAIKWGIVHITECEWNQQEVFIGIPSTKDFVAMLKTTQKMEKRRISKMIPFKVKSRGTDIDLYRVDLSHKTYSLVVAQDLLKMKGVAPDIDGDNNLQKYKLYSLQPAALGAAFQIHARNPRKHFYLKFGVNSGPSINVERTDIPTDTQMPVLGVRTNFKLLIKI